MSLMHDTICRKKETFEFLPFSKCGAVGSWERARELWWDLCFTIKQRIKTLLFIDRMAALYIGETLIRDWADQSDQPVAIVWWGENYTFCWIAFFTSKGVGMRDLGTCLEISLTEVWKKLNIFIWLYFVSNLFESSINLTINVKHLILLLVHYLLSIVKNGKAMHLLLWPISFIISWAISSQQIWYLPTTKTKKVLIR